MDINGSLWRDSQGSKNSDNDVVPPVGDPAHLQAAPPGLSRRLSQIPLLDHNEPNLTRGLGYVSVASEARQGVTPLNPLDNLHVFGVLAAVLVGGDPLVGDVERAGLHYAEDFGVDLFELGRVTRGLDGVGAVEGVVGEGHIEEIAADNLAKGIKASFFVVEAGAVHLVVVDCDAHNVRAGVGRNSPHWAAHAAAHVHDSVSGPCLNEIDRHLLVDARGLAVGLAGDRGGEVEGLAPPPLVDVGH